MTDAIDFSTFTDYKDAKTGGILVLLPLLGALFAGLTAAGSTAGVVANSVLQANKNEEQERHNKEIEKISRGEGLSEHDGGFIPLVPLHTAIVGGITALENGVNISEAQRYINNAIQRLKRGEGLQTVKNTGRNCEQHRMR